MEILLILLVMLGLMALGFPVASALFGSSIFGIFAFMSGTRDLLIMGQIAYQGVFSSVLLAIPLFILMGNLMFRVGIARDLFDMVSAWMRHLPGGLAVASVSGCGLFAAISGSSAATAATIGSVSIGEMRKRGYPNTLSVGTVASAATLGILIPPSIPLILYSMVTDVSPGALFAAGMIPGLVSLAAYMIYIVARVKIVGDVALLERATWAERWRVSLRAIWAVSAIPLILGGIYAGWFTPTEAAAVGVIYTLLLGTVVYRRLTWKDFYLAGRDAVATTSMILLILVAAKIFGFVAINLGLSRAILGVVEALQLSQIQFLILICLMYLVMGMFLDPTSIILITVPVLWPVLQSLDISPIWFAIILVKNLEMANVTPPLGFNLLVLQGVIRNLSLRTLVRGVAPFLVVDVVLIGIIIAFPALSLWLPGVLY